MAISVGSVEVDVIPNTRGIYARMNAGLTPAATRVGDDMGRIIGERIAIRIAPAIREGIEGGARAARPSAARQGDETGGAFSRALKTRLEAAFRSLPKLQVDASTSEADAELQALRVRMETLAGKRIGIDIDAEAARVEIRYLEGELERLGASHANVQVRADTAAARAQLVAVRAEIDAVDGKRARIDVDTSGALSAILHLTVAIGGLAIIPAIPVLAAGIGAIGAAATASAVGVGALVAVAAPAIIGIAGALQAQKAAQDAAATATARGAQASSQAASRALQMAGAQQALATAHRSAARQISQAEQSVGDAVRSAAEANERAAEQVKAARQAVTDAVQQAAERQQSAAESVSRAEESLADAQRQARQAQQDLTQARKDASLELAELGDRLTNARLAERDAVLSVEEARTRLAAVQAKGGSASLVEQQRAQLAYDQAVQRLKEQTTETKSLAEEKKAADRAGVEGSQTVKDAQERIAASARKVAEEQKGLGKAQAEAASQQIQSQRAIAEAQQKVADASRNVSRTQEDGARAVQRAQESLVAAQQSAADSIASAQRQIASASASAAGGVDQAAVAQEKYQAALAKLTPSARGTFDAFQSLKTAFKDWSTSLQPAVMPLFTRALEGMKNSLPGLTPFVLAAAKAIGILQDKVSAGFKSPWWQSFRDDLATSVLPATVGMGTAIGNVFKTLGGIVDAFLPHMDSISQRMQTITGRWAAWATGLKGSEKFERFLDYSSKQGPILAEAIRRISSGFFELARAASPLSGPVLTALGSIASAIGSIAVTLPWLIQLLYAVWVATKLWTLSMIILNAAMSANPITLIIIGIVALVALVIYAYKHWGWFREAVNAAWEGIKTGAAWVWSFLQPILAGIWSALQFVGRIAMQVWENAIRPAFEGIWLAARILFAIVVTAVITPIYLAIKVLGAFAMWLWRECFRPALEGIGAAAMWVWNTLLKPVFGWIGDKATALWESYIRPAWDSVKSSTSSVGDRFREFWNSYVKPIFTWIAEKATWLYDIGLKPAFENIKKAVGFVKDAFVLAKDGIKSAWDKLVEITRRPVEIIVNTVYNQGIRKVWNAVAKIVNLDELDEYKFRTGGVLPGYTPGRDPHTFVSPTGGVIHASGGEAFMRPEFTKAVGAGWVGRMNAAARTGGVGGVRREMAFKDGGILDKIVSGAKSVGSWIGDGVDLLTNPTKAWDKATGFIRESLAGIGAGPWAGAIGKIPIEMLSGLKKILVDSVGSLGIGASSGGSPGGGVTRWTGVVQQALAMLGQPLAYTDITLRRMNQESGGNPNIVNTWDSNWLAGYPSVGLMQVIGPTFRAYAGAMRDIGPFLYGTSVNPLANVYSSMRYALAAYGSLPRAYNRAGGYDSGGYLQPGLNLAYNGTGRPEPVFTTGQANALMRMATGPTGGGGFAPGQEVTLVVQDGPTLRAYVDGRATRQIIDIGRQQLQATRAGRNGV